MDNTIDNNDVVINSRNYTMDIFKAIFAIGVITYDIVYLTESGELVYVWLAPALIIIFSIIII